jgi:hypothetical protein
MSEKKFVLLFGPPAVGKMSVGRELEKLSGLKLFHNHMTIELVLPFFEFGSPSFSKLNNSFRMDIFNEVAKSELAGMTFTFVWALDLDGEKEYVESITKVFADQGAKIFFVELQAELSERLTRNRGVERLEAKASKRDVEASEKRLLSNHQKYQMNTKDGEVFPFPNFLKIDSTKLSPLETAKKINEFIS